MEPDELDLVEDSLAEPLETSDEPEDWQNVLGLRLMLSVEIGHSTASMKHWLALGVGSQVVLDREHRDPVVLRLNGRLSGSGHVVLVGNRFGVMVDSWGRKG